MKKRHYLKTKDVAQSVHAYAKSFKIPTKEVDFKIADVVTRYTNDEQKEWIEAEDKESTAKLKDPEFLSDPSLKIEQELEIELFHNHRKHTYPLKLGANKDKTKVVLVVLEKTKLKYSPKIKHTLQNFIHKQMALNGYLINIWDITEPLQEFVDVLEEAQKIRYGQRQFITVAQSPLPLIPSTDDSFILTYKNEERSPYTNDRIDYKKREFAFGVEEGDLIMQYIKPIEGSDGRDCKGQYLHAGEPKQTQQPSFSVSQKIEAKEGDTSIDYIAKKSGYVIYENNTYDIGQYLEVETVDFKTTGDIDLGMHSDIRLLVNGKGDMSDSVGQGMEINAHEINVLSGTVGSGVQIHAHKVNIASVTHQNSKIYADDVTINVHNGYVNAKTVHIKRLEGGVVHAHKVIVDQAVGGEIRASEVYIDTLTSNSMIYASNIIEVTKLKGEDNEFMIDPGLVDGLKEEIDTIESEIDRFKQARENVAKELMQKRRGLKQNESVLKKIRELIETNRQKQVKTPATYLQKLQKIQALFKSVKILEEEVKLLDEELSDLHTQIAIKQSIVLNAKVINKSRWSGYNKVSFSLLSPEIVKETTTQGKKNVIMLKEGNDGGYKIESSDFEEID